MNVDSSSSVNGGGMIYSVNDGSTSAVNVDACYPPLWFYFFGPPVIYFPGGVSPLFLHFCGIPSVTLRLFCSVHMHP